MITKKIRDGLREIEDKNLGLDVIESGIVKEIKADDSGVSVAIDPMGMTQTHVDKIRNEIKDKINQKTDVNEINIVQGNLAEPVKEQEVRARLRDVSHPGLTGNIVESETVKDIDIEKDKVAVKIDQSTLGEETRNHQDEFFTLIANAVYNAEGVRDVYIDTDKENIQIDKPQLEDPPFADAPSMAGPPGLEGMTPLDQPEKTTIPPTMDLSGINNIIVVASAKGGVGKTTVATQLARGLTNKVGDVGLLDTDFSGPDVPEVMGIDETISETDVVEPVVHDGIDVMSVGLMENRPTAWNGEMVHNSLFNLVEDIDWGVDTLVIDIPPGASDTLMTLLQFVPIDGVLLVTTPHPTSVKDTEKGAALFREGGVPILGVVVNMAGFKCPSCDENHSLFDSKDLEMRLDYPVIKELPFSDEIRTQIGDVPDEIMEIVEVVTENLKQGSLDSVDVIDDALDVRDFPQHSRIDEVKEEFLALEAGEELSVVSDRNPAGLAVALVDILDADGAPSEIFDGYSVDAYAPDEWLLSLRKPM